MDVMIELPPVPEPKGVPIDGIVELEGPFGGLVGPVEILIDDAKEPLAEIVALGMGNGADEPGTWAVIPLETPELMVPPALLGPTVEPIESVVVFINDPVGIGVELRETGPGPVDTRLPVDDNTGVVALLNGNGGD